MAQWKGRWLGVIQLEEKIHLQAQMAGETCVGYVVEGSERVGVEGESGQFAWETRWVVSVVWEGARAGKNGTRNTNNCNVKARAKNRKDRPKSKTQPSVARVKVGYHEVGQPMGGLCAPLAGLHAQDTVGMWLSPRHRDLDRPEWSAVG